VIVAAAAPVPAIRQFTPEVWTRLRSASAKSVSIDGKRILFEVDHGVAKGPTQQEWWTMSPAGAGAKKLVLPKGFAPDGFTRDGALFGTYADKEKPPQIAILRTPGSAFVTLTNLPRGVGSLVVSPDGTNIATLTSNKPKDPLEDVRTVVENSVSTPYVVSIEKSDGKFWCPSLTDAADMAWSPDGRALAVLSQVQKIGHHEVRGSLDICRAGGVTHVTEIPNAASSVAWLDEGATLAFLSTATPTLTPEHIYTVPAAGGTPMDQTPNLAGTAPALTVDPHGRVWVFVYRGVQGEVDRFAGNVLTPAYTVAGGMVFGPPVFSPFAGSTDRLAFTVSDPTHTPNVAVAEGDALKTISHEGDDLLAGLDLGPVRVVHWQGPDTPLIGIVTFPPGYVAGKRYPFVNLPHGGPEGNDVLAFNFDARLLAARGYVVMQPEYRGSTGVNAAFTAFIYQHFGDRAYADVESATDYAIAQGWADPQHLGMWGWSAGGFMTAWTVTQTQRYRAAVEGAGITDWLSFIPASDIAQVDYDARSHIADPQAFLNFSPIMFADRVTTPLLILDGEADRRVPSFQGREFFVFLRELGKTARMVTYPGSPHFPRLWEQRRNVFDETFAWFDRYL
jgi:dipeptidyl aminopeptidase/acylaminoacyl peptidase